jgi:hypothetical protein
MNLLQVCCSEDYVIDQATNRVSLFNLIEDMPSAVFPFAIYSFCIFSYWERENGELDTSAQLTIEIGDTILFQSPLALTFQDQIKCRAVMKIHGLGVLGPGTMVVKVSLGDVTKGTWKVNVISAPQVVPA